MANGVVTDHKTLYAMERKGFIIRNGKAKDRERHWGGSLVPVVTVEPGPRLKYWRDQFNFHGKTYKLYYFDGCFKPFVVEVGAKLPSFV